VPDTIRYTVYGSYADIKCRVSCYRSSHFRTPALGLLATNKFSCSDLSILAVKNRKAIFIEVKRDKGRMSPEQHDFARNVVLAGGEYHVARSIDDVQRLGL
jgi:hypothetical protein